MFEKTKLVDLAERVTATFAEGFLGILLAGPLVGLDASMIEAAAAGGLASALSVVKNFVAQNKPGSDGTGNITT
tara:strand:+ start:1088 stop:1309 length:222 start_codon:yes stop_codon:yes gene_type:complete